MSRKSLLIWILLLLIVAVLKTSASGASDEINYENGGNEGTNLDDVSVSQDEQEEEEEDHEEEEEEEEEEEHAQRQEEYSLTDFLSQNTLPDPEILFSNIIGGAFSELSDGILINFPPDYILYLLINPIGARLAASRPFEIFTESNHHALILDLIHENFFINLDLFSHKVKLECLHQIPAHFIIKTIQICSLDLNLNGFIAKFEKYDQELSFKISKVMCLPHLFDFPHMVNPEFFMARGISFDASLPKKDNIIWDISLQLFLYRLLNEETYKISGNAFELLRIVKQEIASSRGQNGNDIDFNINYFGLENAINFNVMDDFVTTGFLTLEERSVDINELSSSLGLPSFIDIDYSSLEVEKRIVYRLIIYFIIFNPSLLSGDVRNNLIINFLSFAPSDDFTVAELDFLASACINHNLGDVIATMFRNSVFKKFLKSIESKVAASVQAYNSVVSSITNEMDKFLFMRRGTVFFKNGIKIKDEEFYRQKQASYQNDPEAPVSVEDEKAGSPLVRTKRLRNGDKVPESHFSSHFLTMEQLQSFGPLESNESDGINFIVPYPNKDYFIARYDNLMQNLDSADLGEIEWKTIVRGLDAEVKEAYEQHEKDLDEFVRLVFQAIDCMRTRPLTDVYIYFKGSPSHGDGLKLEAFETFARAILLPRFKVFCYNSDLNGFIPYPLIHHDIMASLGYLNRWFLSNGLPLSWNLSADYLKFLFYQEDPFESMQNLIETFYKSIFKNIEGLTSPGISPLDYFTTTFYSHQPLAFYDQTITETSPLDLFAPIESTENNSQYASLFNYLDEDTINFLSEPIYPQVSTHEESKCEIEHLIESKDDFEGNDLMETQGTIEDSYFRQLELKIEIVEAIKHAASQEIIQSLLFGRFAFIRNFLPFFNSHSQNHVTSTFYFSLQMAQAKEITADTLISGLSFSNERNDIKIYDGKGNVYTPRQTLETILRALPQEMMKTFYWFCTGCLTLPLGDLISKPIGVVVSQNPILPASRTCFRSLTFNLNPALNLRGHVEAMRQVLTESSGFHVNEGINAQNQIVGVFIDIATNHIAVADEPEPDSGDIDLTNSDLNNSDLSNSFS